MTEPGAFHQAFKAQEGQDFVKCPNCDEASIPGQGKTLEPEPSGRIYCNVCAFLFWPVKLEAE